MHLHTNQMSDSFRIGAILAMVGGLLDAYTFLIRGQVFSNAQTGNMVLLGIHLWTGNWLRAWFYLVPILAFVLGIFINEWIKRHLDGLWMFHWRQIVLLMEIVALVVVVLLPPVKTDTAANALISFICSLQVQSFRKVHGLQYATTMCTGNLRSGTEYLVQYFQTKERKQFEKSLNYYGIILFFILGAGMGAIFCTKWHPLPLVLCLILLCLVFLMLFQKPETSSAEPKSKS